MLISKIILPSVFAPLVHAQTWSVLSSLLFYPSLLLIISYELRCGKVYMKNETVVPPSGQFTQPTGSLNPLLALRCTPALRPYLPEDSSLQTSIIVDALLRYEAIAGAENITLDGDGGQGQLLNVTASIGGTEFARGTVGLNGTTDLVFRIEDLSTEPSLDAYNITCTASTSDGSQTFTSQTQLYYIPEPDSSIGSVTKMDLRTGGLLAKPFGQSASAMGGDANGYEAVFPVGYYTSFDWLVGNVSVLETLKEQG